MDKMKSICAVVMVYFILALALIASMMIMCGCGVVYKNSYLIKCFSGGKIIGGWTTTDINFVNGNIGYFEFKQNTEGKKHMRVWHSDCTIEEL